ncbi:hypothetical protein ACTMTF_33360 [Nonomuraea sp. ZG12]|uniref:hypothetical protein n=1 Tax=Nonomuraea sp. ZG12 TaxID=3452207 RepID=UPI003F8B612A
MKTRILGAVMGIAALSGLLVASPAQARDGVSSARVSNPDRAGAGYAQTTVDFVNRKKVIFRNFKVRDICPADNHGVRARIEWIHTDRTRGYGAWKKDTSCGSHGTNFGNFVRRGSKSIKLVYVKVCISTKKGQHLACKEGKWRHNQYA